MSVYELKSKSNHITCGYFCSLNCVTKYQDAGKYFTNPLYDYVAIKLTTKQMRNRLEKEGPSNCEVCDKKLIDGLTKQQRAEIALGISFICEICDCVLPIEGKCSYYAYTALCFNCYWKLVTEND